ncbi:MAG TPA: Calx-beta domain-containing protein, partial [Thermoanaerobaculia bacterium]|nr:Calx-beta domain-containing protein [Thermoanaerobaculia bacterium]
TFAETVSPPLLTAGDVRVFEGDAGTTRVEVPVRLSAPSSDPISVPWHTTDGTALAGIDYERATGTVDFAPGETFRTVIVLVIGNTKKEDDKTFSVVFDAAANVQIATTSANVVIGNDDEADAPPPSRRRGVRH